MMKEQKGITLIALVITIIVLLILAGVSIAMLTGENGILTKATTSKTETEKAEVAERINMELNAVYADVLSGDITDFTKISPADLKKINDNLAEKATAEAISATEFKIKPKDTTLATVGTITINSNGGAPTITASAATK